MESKENKLVVIADRITSALETIFGWGLIGAAILFVLLEVLGAISFLSSSIPLLFTAPFYTQESIII